MMGNLKTDFVKTGFISDLCLNTSAISMAEAVAPATKEFLAYSGPKPGVTYPLKVVYCGGT